MKICCDQTIIPENCSPCEEVVDACCVIDASAISCLDIPAKTPQCEINRILAQAICDGTGGNTCCPEWQDITAFGSSGDYTWSVYDPTGFNVQEPQYTVPTDCTCKKVKLRGMVKGNWTQTQMLMFTLPAGVEPAYTRVYPTVVSVDRKTFFYPAVIIVSGNSVYLQLPNTSCCSDVLIGTGDKLYVTLESVEFESI